MGPTRGPGVRPGRRLRGQGGCGTEAGSVELVEHGVQRDADPRPRPPAGGRLQPARVGLKDDVLEVDLFTFEEREAQRKWREETAKEAAAAQAKVDKANKAAEEIGSKKAVGAEGEQLRGSSSGPRRPAAPRRSSWDRLCFAAAGPRVQRRFTRKGAPPGPPPGVW